MKLFKEIQKLDLEIDGYAKSIQSRTTTDIIRSIAINPSVFYLTLFTINFLYFDNRYWIIFPLTIIATGIIVIIKQFIKRQRPIEIKGHLLLELLDFKPDNYSFPSAHAFTMFQLAPIAFLLLGYWSLLLSTYAIFIAYTRIYLRFHYFSDVIVGGLLGLMSGILIVILVT